MKYQDYYKILGVDRSADAATVKGAYRKLARKYHPDVSKEPNAEARFKEIAEAYKTLKDPTTRAAYDQLGSYQSGQDFQPPPDWRQRFGDGQFSFDDIDLADLFASVRGGSRRTRGAERGLAVPGQDFDVAVRIPLIDAYRGTEVNLDLAMPEYDAQGFVHRVPHAFTARIPKGATDGQRLRVPGKGGKGLNGGRAGDLFLAIEVEPHPLFRVSGHNLYLDLPLTPAEAILGTSVEVPTLGGPVMLKVPAGTYAGQQLRLARRGLPRPHEGEGDLYAIVQIAVPRVTSEQERALYQQLAERSTFNPRAHFT